MFYKCSIDRLTLSFENSNHVRDIATLNAQKMIRNNLHKNSRWDRAKLSINQFLKNRSMAGKTVSSCILIFLNIFFDLRQFLQQAANISIKITTTEETGSINDQDNNQDMDKTDICHSEFVSLGQITDFSYFQTSTGSNECWRKKAGSYHSQMLRLYPHVLVMISRDSVPV